MLKPGVKYHVVPAAALNKRRTPPRLLVLCVLMVSCVLAPLVSMVLQAGHFGYHETIELLLRPLVGDLALNTLLIVSVTTAVAGVIGTSAAWLVERTELPGRQLWGLLAIVPLAIPTFITSYAWLSLCPDLPPFVGALLVVTTAYYPLVYLPVAAALRGLDPTLEETARSLGLGHWAVFFRVVLPQIKQALLGGMLLVALNVLSEFGAFALLRFHTFTTEIYAEYRASFDSSGASLLSSLLMLLCLLCLMMEFRIRGTGRHDRIDKGARRLSPRYALGGWRWPVLTLFSILLAATLLLPIGMIVYWLLQHKHSVAAVTPVEFSVAQWLDASAASLSFGLAGAVFTTIMALPLSYLLVRYPSGLATLLERLSYFGQGVPGIVVALAVIDLAIHWVRPLYQSALLLVVTYAILFLPMALVGVRGSLVLVETRLEEIAQTLGLSVWQRTWRVLLPLAGPGIGAAAAMVFTGIVTELTATLLLSPTGTHTLATEVWADTSTLAFAAAAPYAAMLMAISLFSTWILMALLGKSVLLPSL